MSINQHRKEIATIAGLCLGGVLFYASSHAPVPLRPSPVAEAQTLAQQDKPMPRLSFSSASTLPPHKERPAIEVAPVYRAVEQYAAGRFQAFFDEEAALEEFRQGGASWLAVLRDDLQDAEPLESLPEDTQFQRHRPKVVLERMARIDVLTELAKTDPAARRALMEVAELPIDSGLPMHVKRAIIGERYDILFRLVQQDRDSALSIYRGYPLAARRVLLPALLTGLSEAQAAPVTVHQLLGSEE